MSAKLKGAGTVLHLAQRKTAEELVPGQHRGRALKPPLWTPGWYQDKQQVRAKHTVGVTQQEREH